MGSPGLRTGCLYLCLALLGALILLTTLTIHWVIATTNLGLTGLGSLSLVEGGMKVSGDTFIMDGLYASRISSGAGLPLKFLSDGNFSISINGETSFLSSDFQLGPDGLKISAAGFSVTSPSHRRLLSVSRHSTVIGSHRLIATGKGGIVLKEALATRAVRSPAGHHLSLESSTASLSLLGPGGVSVDSIAGGIEISAYHDIKLRARGHNSEFKIDAGTIRLPRLTEWKASKHKATPAATQSNQTIYQLCLCRSGRLFVSPAMAHCVADSHVCRDQ